MGRRSKLLTRTGCIVFRWQIRHTNPQPFPIPCQGTQRRLLPTVRTWCQGRLWAEDAVARCSCSSGRIGCKGYHDELRREVRDRAAVVRPFLHSTLSCPRWGKERPLNTRLLIQNVELPTYDVNCVPGLKGDHDEASWSVQVFRSITSDSAR